MLYISYLRTTDDIVLARSVVTAVATLCGLVLILFVEPPTRALTGGDPYSGDRRPVALVVAMLALFGVVLVSPAARAFLELAPLAPLDLAIVGIAAVLWAFGIRYIWRAQLMGRWLGMKLQAPPGCRRARPATLDPGASDGAAERDGQDATPKRSVAFL
jgi:hypothetical protein